MLEKRWAIAVSLTMVLLASCSWHGQSESTDNNSDSLQVDSVLNDSIEEMESFLEDEVASARVDELFEDFIFTFVRSHSLQRQRINFPLSSRSIDGSEHHLQRSDWYDDFHFLQGEYYTMLFTDAEQQAYRMDTTIQYVSVEYINLKNRTLRSYDFRKLRGKWMLDSIADNNLENTDLEEFCQFYHRFSTDSTFQMESLANNVHVSMPDPDDEGQTIDGTIDINQWPYFCPELPVAELSNIRYSQSYRNTRCIIMQKCGSGNGLQETLKFEKDNKGWKLTAYDN